MRFFIGLALLLFSMQSFAHSGRTNAQGCHNDNINGGYHCHNRPEARSVSSENESATVMFNTKSHKYHRPSCRSAKACIVNCIAIKKSEAISQGGIPCKNCGG